MMKNIPQQPWIPLVGLLAVLSSCGAEPAAASAQSPGGAAVAAAPVLRPFERDLLELAFTAASAFLLDPHGKNRSRAQELVVVACFGLEQPELALAYGTRIADWRRGCAYADYAWAVAKRGERAKALEYVALAEGVVKAEAENPHAQEWRRDLIALKIARVHGTLGDDAAAAKAAAGIDANSTHAVDGTFAATAEDRLRRMDRAAAAAEFAAIDAGFATMTLGQQNTALGLLARLHEQFFADRDLRTACEQRVAVTWAKLLPGLRLDALARMVRSNLAHGEPAAAKALVATMRELVEAHRWRAEDRLPQVSRLIELTFAVGDVDRAKAAANEALAAWHQEREGIVDIFRAETLRPLAIACFAIGERGKGEELLALVLEEGMENPNSRPRCDDLVETCVALCQRGIEPSAAAWARLREIQKGLGQPW